MIQQISAIWSLIPVPFLNPAWTSGSYWFMYCWNLAWRFEHYFASVWDECNCALIWAFFGIAFLWDWNENWPLPVLWPLLSFPNLLGILSVALLSVTESPFRISGIPSPPLAVFIVMLSKAHLTSHSRMSGFRWVITPSWLSGSWSSFFVQFFCVFLSPLLNIFYYC